MSIFGPYDVRVGILQRSTRFIDALVRQRPGTTALQLYGAKSIEAAYGNLTGSGVGTSTPTALMMAPSNGFAVSPTIIKRNMRTEENRRGQTTFQFDLEDFSASDDIIYFLRMQEMRGGAWQVVTGAANTGTPYLGPIYVLMPMPLYGSAAHVLTLQSKAPLLTTSVAGSIPAFDPAMQVPIPMHLVLPRPAATVTIKNLATAAGDKLLVSFGLGLPMMEIAPGDETIPTGGGYSLPGVREIILASASTAGAAVPFSVEVTIGMEGSA